MTLVIHPRHSFYRTALLTLAALTILVPSSLRAQDPGEYRLGPKDLIEIKVLEIPELNMDRRVGDDGDIDLPLLGQFPVAGLTASEVRDKLETILRSKYVNRANVSVIIKEYANKPVSILGAVEHPGSLTISGRWTLLQAISAAGGLAQNAGKKIFVIRQGTKGLSQTLEINVADLFTGASTWNIPIYPSDVVNIPPRTKVNVFVLGEVRTPGALEFSSDDRLTLLSVIAKAGGLSDRASKHIRIKRRGSDGKDQELQADYNRIVSGRDKDPEIKPDDVVIVKASFF